MGWRDWFKKSQVDSTEEVDTKRLVNAGSTITDSSNPEPPSAGQKLPTSTLLSDGGSAYARLDNNPNPDDHTVEEHSVVEASDPSQPVVLMAPPESLESLPDARADLRSHVATAVAMPDAYSYTDTAEIKAIKERLTNLVSAAWQQSIASAALSNDGTGTSEQTAKRLLLQVIPSVLTAESSNLSGKPEINQAFLLKFIQEELLKIQASNEGSNAANFTLSEEEITHLVGTAGILPEYLEALKIHASNVNQAQTKSPSAAGDSDLADLVLNLGSQNPYQKLDAESSSAEQQSLRARAASSNVGKYILDSRPVKFIASLFSGKQKLKDGDIEMEHFLGVSPTVVPEEPPQHLSFSTQHPPAKTSAQVLAGSIDGVDTAEPVIPVAPQILSTTVSSPAAATQSSSAEARATISIELGPEPPIPEPELHAVDPAIDHEFTSILPNNTAPPTPSGVAAPQPIPEAAALPPELPQPEVLATLRVVDTATVSASVAPAPVTDESVLQRFEHDFLTTLKDAMKYSSLQEQSPTATVDGVKPNFINVFCEQQTKKFDSIHRLFDDIRGEEQIKINIRRKLSDLHRQFIKVKSENDPTKKIKDREELRGEARDLRRLFDEAHINSEAWKAILTDLKQAANQPDTVTTAQTAQAPAPESESTQSQKPKEPDSLKVLRELNNAIKYSKYSIKTKQQETQITTATQSSLPPNSVVVLNEEKEIFEATHNETDKSLKIKSSQAHPSNEDLVEMVLCAKKAIEDAGKTDKVFKISGCDGVGLTEDEAEKFYLDAIKIYLFGKAVGLNPVISNKQDVNGNIIDSTKDQVDVFVANITASLASTDSSGTATVAPATKKLVELYNKTKLQNTDVTPEDLKELSKNLFKELRAWKASLTEPETSSVFDFEKMNQASQPTRHAP